MPPAPRAVVPPRGVEEAGARDHQRVPRRGCVDGGLGGSGRRCLPRGRAGWRRNRSGGRRGRRRCPTCRASIRVRASCSWMFRRAGWRPRRLVECPHRSAAPSWCLIRRRRGLDGRELHVLDVVVRLRRLLRVVYRNVYLRNIHRIRRLWNLRVVGGHHDARAKVTPELVSRPARVVPLTRGGGSRRVSRAVGLMHGRRLAAAAEDGRDPQLGARGRGQKRRREAEHPSPPPSRGAHEIWRSARSLPSQKARANLNC